MTRPFRLPLRKVYDLAAVSSLGWDQIDYVSGSFSDGRVDLLRSEPDRVGGTAANGLVGTLCLGGQAALAGALGEDPEGDAFRDTIRGLGINVDYLLQVAGKPTVKNRIAVRGGSRCIMRRAGARLQDLANWELDSLRSLIAQCRGLFVGNVPMALTQLWSDWCAKTGTLLAIAPGSEQLPHLGEIHADFVILNVEEARTATLSAVRHGGRTQQSAEASPEQVFESLVDLCGNVRWLVQTGGGEHEAWLFDRQTGHVSAVAPANLDRLPSTQFLNVVGTGDVAAAGTFRRLLAGDTLHDAYAHWGRPLATAHLLFQQFSALIEFCRWRDQHATAFQPQRVRAAA